MPSATEFQQLIAFIVQNQQLMKVNGAWLVAPFLKMRAVWDAGTAPDDYGFALYPAGIRYVGTQLIGAGHAANLWTASAYSTSPVWFAAYEADEFPSLPNSDGAYAAQVRCVKD